MQPASRLRQVIVFGINFTGFNSFSFLNLNLKASPPDYLRDRSALVSQARHFCDTAHCLVPDFHKDFGIEGKIYVHP